MGNKFPYIRAAQVIAHAKLFSKAAACNYYGVKPPTYDNWRARLNTDEKLIELVEQASRELVEHWKADSIKTLKMGLASLQKAFENDFFDEKPKKYNDKIAWTKGVTATSQAIKNVGDLTIGTHVLFDEDDEDEDEDEGEQTENSSELKD